MTPPRLGVSFAPAGDPAALRALARRAEAAGLDLIGLPDHPYVPRYLDVLTVAADLLAQTSTIGVFTDVANLPLRPPAVLAKAAATLGLQSGGRFDLGLGAGQAWAQIEAMGTPARRPAEALAAVEEAVGVIRAMWRRGQQRLDGEHYRLDGVGGGPVPPGTEIWLGAVFPRMLRLTGRIADGWAAPIPAYLPYEKWREAQAHVDEGAAGRPVRRIAQVVGTVGDRDEPWTVEGDAPVRLTPRGWAGFVERLLGDFGFDDVIFWPEEVGIEQVARFGEEVAPLVRG